MKKTTILFALILAILTGSSQNISIVNNKIVSNGGALSQITSLDLSGLGLSELPENISEFTSLQELDLSYNQLKEVSSLNNLEHIEELILDENLHIRISTLFTSLNSWKKLNPSLLK